MQDQLVDLGKISPEVSHDYSGVQIVFFTLARPQYNAIQDGVPVGCRVDYGQATGLLKHPSLLWLSDSFYVYFKYYVFLQPLCATESGMPKQQTKWFNIVYGFGSLIGRLFSGPLTQPLLRRDKCKFLYLACLFMYSLSSFVISLTIEFEYFMLYMIFIGLLNGTMATLFFLVTLEVVGLTGFPTACGINLAISGVSCTLGPPMAGKDCMAYLALLLLP